MGSVLRTAEGRTVEVIESEHYKDVRFVIDGEEAETLTAQMYRDGGTRRYVTSKGIVVFPHRIGSDDRTPKLDGEPLEPE